MPGRPDAPSCQQRAKVSTDAGLNAEPQATRPGLAHTFRRTQAAILRHVTPWALRQSQKWTGVPSVRSPSVHPAGVYRSNQ